MQSIENASFRDPSGYVFYENDKVYRFIHSSYRKDFELLIQSGLYDALRKDRKLIAIEETDISSPSGGTIIQVEKVEFISYPYEWCFSQYQEAALLTLDLMERALEFDIWLKDASAYNIQFHNGNPVLIDLFSFEQYPEGSPWVAYRQFCQHFLSPLLLMSKVDMGLGSMMKNYIDGIPLDITSKLLPFRCKLSPQINMHIFMQAKYQKKYEDYGRKTEIDKNKSVSILTRNRLKNLISSLKDVVTSLSLAGENSEWANYYDDTNYSKDSLYEKKDIIERFAEKISPQSMCDFGANKGEFSRIKNVDLKNIISCDIDYIAVDKNYRINKEKGLHHILPLRIDLTNPSPAIGWANVERKSFIDRCDVDLGLALALIHHLAISNNVPLENCASLFASMTQYLVIEWVPKEDSQVQRLLATREDIFDKYNQTEFENEFSKYFKILEKKQVTGSKRVIYLMRLNKREGME